MVVWSVRCAAGAGSDFRSRQGTSTGGVLLASAGPEDKTRGRLDLSHLTLLEGRENKEIILVYPRSYNAYTSNEWATVRLAVK